MLTPKQRDERAMRILSVIELSLDATGEVPTVLQMSRQLGMAHSSLHEALVRMQRDGLIEWDKHAIKTLYVTDYGDLTYERAKRGKEMGGLV